LCCIGCDIKCTHVLKYFILAEFLALGREGKVLVVLLAKVVVIAVSYHHLVCNLTRLVYIASSHRLL